MGTKCAVTGTVSDVTGMTTTLTRYSTSSSSGLYNTVISVDSVVHGGPKIRSVCSTYSKTVLFYSDVVEVQKTKDADRG